MLQAASTCTLNPARRSQNSHAQCRRGGRTTPPRSHLHLTPEVGLGLPGDVARGLYAPVDCVGAERATEGSDEAGCLCKTADENNFRPPGPSRLLRPLRSAASAVAGHAPGRKLQRGTTHGPHDLMKICDAVNQRREVTRIRRLVARGGGDNLVSVGQGDDGKAAHGARPASPMEYRAGSAAFRGARHRDLQPPTDMS